MARAKDITLQIKVDFRGEGGAPPLQAFVFTSGGKLLGSAELTDGTAAVEVPRELDGHAAEVILGPPIGEGQPQPTAAGLKRMGAHASPARILTARPELKLSVSPSLFPRWCLCTVRGRLVKRITLPGGTLVERPVCNARVTICEIDSIPLVISRIPDHEIYRLRDDLLRDPILEWPFPPGPKPDPVQLAQPGRFTAASAGDGAAHESDAPVAPGSRSRAATARTTSVDQLRNRITALGSELLYRLCDLSYLWRYFTKDCLTVVEADGEGRFSTLIAYDCHDTPDLYFSVEQFRDGAWQQVYRPSIGCGTHWNYACGTEVVLNLPGAVACETPTIDIPAGVLRFVLPWAIGDAPLWGTPAGAPAAPGGWVRPDGRLDYVASGLGLLHDAPFGGTLNFVQDDSYYIPSTGIKYYRYSCRRQGVVPNTGVNDASWTPISASLARGYRIEYSDRLPTYQAYGVGPHSVNGRSGLFEFKPLEPPTLPTDGPTAVHREWTSGNLSEVAASWDTSGAAPPLSETNTVDDAGTFEVKVEVFDKDGNAVVPGAATFSFLLRNADGTTARLATSGEQAGGALVFLVHVDNNGSSADLPQPSIGGVAASDDCGFLRYGTGDSVLVRYLAAHPNDEAVFSFGIVRGSNGLAAASTLAPYVEVAAASAPTGTSAYTKVAGYYERGFAPSELVGDCVNAAFAASLHVVGKATNGSVRLGLDASGLIAFALAERPPPP